jgi:hypothetical protein
MQIGGDVFLHDRTFEQVDLPELTSEFDQLPKGILVFGIMDTRKVNL